MIPSIYINLEDDVSAISTRIKKERSGQIVLVCPKRCFLFSDPINLKLLKTQADLLGKEIFILTMDEKGRGYGQAAGFGLRFLPKVGAFKGISDIKVAAREQAGETAQPLAEKLNVLSGTVEEIKKIAKSLVSPKQETEVPQQPVIPPVVSVQTAEPEINWSEPEQSAIPETAVKDSIFPYELDNVLSEETNQEIKKKSNQKIILALFVFAAALALALVFLILPKATVLVYPKVEPVVRDMDISIGTAIAQADPGKLVLPALKVDEMLEAGQKFDSQGKKEVGSKAAGTVIIYNFTKLSVKLKSGTTSLILGDKTYKLSADQVQIRPTLYKNSRTKEVDVNSLEPPMDVIAAQGGESSNVPAGTRLEITNQVFGSNPQLLYAKTQTPIEGGISRYLSVVTDQDTQAAKSQLQERLVSELKNRLDSNNTLILDSGYNVQVGEFTTDKPVGTESPTFEANLKIRITALGFNKNDMSGLIKNRILQTVSDNKTLQQSSDLQDSYKIKSIDLNAGLGVVSAHFDGQAVSKVDLTGLAKELAGKTESQVNDILKSKAEIRRIDVTLAPTWQKTFPLFAKKVFIKIQN